MLALLALATAAAASLPIMALGGPGLQAPDLRADPVEAISGPMIDNSEFGAGHLLLRFDGFVTNVGSGPSLIVTLLYCWSVPFA